MKDKLENRKLFLATFAGVWFGKKIAPALEKLTYVGLGFGLGFFVSGHGIKLAKDFYTFLMVV